MLSHVLNVDKEDKTNRKERDVLNVEKKVILLENALMLKNQKEEIIEAIIKKETLVKDLEGTEDLKDEVEADKVPNKEEIGSETEEDQLLDRTLLRGMPEDKVLNFQEVEVMRKDK